MTEKLGKNFIQALNDFERKGSVHIRMSGKPQAHPSIIVDRTDDAIIIESPTTIHMSHRKLIELDEKLNYAGKYSWMMIKMYVRVINDPTHAKYIHSMDVQQSKYFMEELFHRMLVIIDDGYYDTDNIREVFRAMYNAFGSAKNLENMLIEVIGDILNNVDTSVNICRTCKHCTTIGDTCGYGRCTICTFVPSDTDTVTVSEIQTEYGKHLYSKNGCIYTDITTGQTTCEDYYPRPISGGDTIKGWLFGI